MICQNSQLSVAVQASAGRVTVGFDSATTPVKGGVTPVISGGVEANASILGPGHRARATLPI
jgi:hypothetical protein